MSHCYYASETARVSGKIEPMWCAPPEHAPAIRDSLSLRSLATPLRSPLAVWIPSRLIRSRRMGRFFAAPGSGLFLNVGRTAHLDAAFGGHEDRRRERMHRALAEGNYFGLNEMINNGSGADVPCWRSRRSASCFAALAECTPNASLDKRPTLSPAHSPEHRKAKAKASSQA